MNKALLFVALLMAGALAQGNLLSIMDEMPYNTAKQLGDRFGEYAAEAATAAYKINYKLMMLAPSDVADTSSDLGSAMTGIITSMATIALAYFGMKYMFQASGANERNRVKGEMQNMFVLIVLALVATSIFGIVMGVGSDLTEELKKGMTTNSWTEDNPLVTGAGGNADEVFTQNPIVTLIYTFGLSVSALSLSIRWLFLDISRTLFPLFIALAFVPLDIIKKTGKILLKTLVVFIIIPFVDIVLIGSMTSFIALVGGDPIQQVMTLSFAFMMVGATNLLLPYMAVQASSLTGTNFMSVLSQVRMKAR